MTTTTVELLAYRLIRIEVRRFDRTTTDSELANYVRGVVDLQTQIYDEICRECGKEESEELRNDGTVYERNEKTVTGID
jgi:hypothetical protein